MENFNSFGLPEQLIAALKHLKFDKPTPIQAQVLPPALEGKDILGSAQTGTGKTAAFGIPLVTKLMLNPQGSALVMTPTRELAVQVMLMMEQLLDKRNGTIKTALLIGGESIQKQFQQLKRGPRLIVGTPGRINDHLTRGSLKLSDANFLVLDETDRMLDMGFTPQIDKILKFMPQRRQTMLFSATLPKNIVTMAQKYLHQPVRVSIGEIETPIAKLKQEMIQVTEQNKYEQLLTQLNERTGTVIVFVKTKFGADKMAKRLCQDDHEAEAIHGDLSHNKRERVIKGFRDCKYRVLVATDIAARGLDISHVMHVINYDLPQCPEDYIHRIGRTARAGAEGHAVCFVSPKDGQKWREIKKLIDPTAKSEPYHGGGDSRPPRSNHKPRRPQQGRPAFGRFKGSGSKPPRRSGNEG